MQDSEFGTSLSQLEFWWTSAALALLYASLLTWCAWRRREPPKGYLIALCLTLPCALLAIVVLGTLFLLWMSGFHPVVQMSSPRAWSFWVRVSRPLFFALLFSLLASSASFAVYWRPRRELVFFLARVAVLALGVYALIAILSNVPSA